jgi:hypothetical protein
MSKTRHRFEYGARNFIRRGLTGLGGAAVIIFASKHVYRTIICIDRLDAPTTIPAFEVEFEVTRKNAVSLG